MDLKIQQRHLLVGLVTDYPELKNSKIFFFGPFVD